MMWHKPWTIKEGLTIGVGLILTGLMLELSVGPFVWNALRWPLNAILLSVYLGLLLLAHFVRNQLYIFHFLSTYAAAISALVYCVLLTIVMGLTRQQVNGRWFNDMLSFWPFVLSYIQLTTVLGLTILRRLSTFRPSFVNIRFLLFHLGLFIALVAGTLGNADMQRLKMVTTYHTPEWRALDERQSVVELPIAIELQHFIMETYDDGSPRRFASDILLITESGKCVKATVDVNKPVEVEGWEIYQYGYDMAAGPTSQISIFELVRDPWLPVVYVGIGMLLLGAVCLFLNRTQRKTL